MCVCERVCLIVCVCLSIQIFMIICVLFNFVLAF